MIYGKHINYLKYINNIPAKLFRYLLLYIKLDTYNNILVIIPSISDLPLQTLRMEWKY